VPLPKKFEFFISKWCDIVHYGCVVFKIHVSHGLYFIEVPVCANPCLHKVRIYCQQINQFLVIMLEKLRGALQMKMTATCGIQKFR